MNLSNAVAAAALLATTSCTTGGLPKTPGEKAASYGYVPLDALPIDQARGADSCRVVGEPGASVAAKSGSVPDNAGTILRKLPDQTIRFAVASFDANKGSVSFGPVKLTAKGGQYRAILDYIQADVVPVTLFVRKLVVPDVDAGAPLPRPITFDAPGFRVVGYEVTTSLKEKFDVDHAFAGGPPVPGSNEAQSEEKELANELRIKTENFFQQVTIPIYVGVGLRLSADVLALEGGITLSGLSAIGAEAEAKKISGTLTVQALGVSGKSIATALPLPSKLDQTTIENAILSVGNMRATLYASATGDDGIWVQPRVVGLYSPIGSDPLLINAIYSELSRVRPRWKAPCMAAPASAMKAAGSS